MIFLQSDWLVVWFSRI